MTAETSLYETRINTNRTHSGKAWVVTKDCVVNGRSYCLTQVYEQAGSNYEVVHYVAHPTFDLHKLKRLHDSIVNDWRADNYYSQQIGM